MAHSNVANKQQDCHQSCTSLLCDLYADTPSNFRYFLERSPTFAGLFNTRIFYLYSIYIQECTSRPVRMSGGKECTLAGETYRGHAHARIIWEHPCIYLSNQKKIQLVFKSNCNLLNIPKNCQTHSTDDK